mmetsp:Transcript_63797/g.112707  ORF Transcript_63797/g.112707 Transcript_63797/m.112707 type:complete len:209 (+) Transcript_63797:1358-1984(+)
MFVQERVERGRHSARTRSVVQNLGNEVVAGEGQSVGVGVAHALDRSETAAAEVDAGQRSRSNGVVHIRHLAVEVSVHRLEAVVVVAGVHVGARRSGIVIAVDQEALVGELALHRHDLVLTVITLEEVEVEISIVESVAGLDLITASPHRCQMVVVAHRVGGDLLAVLRQLTIHTGAGAGGRGSIRSHVGVMVLVGHTSTGAEAVVVQV